jgi:hypothetical protein
MQKLQSEYIARWIEKWCVNARRAWNDCRLYDTPSGSIPSEPVDGRLAAYLVLVHVASRLASGDRAPPPAVLHTDIFTV